MKTKADLEKENEALRSSLNSYSDTKDVLIRKIEKLEKEIINLKDTNKMDNNNLLRSRYRIETVEKIYILYFNITTTILKLYQK